MVNGTISSPIGANNRGVSDGLIGVESEDKELVTGCLLRRRGGSIGAGGGVKPAVPTRPRCPNYHRASARCSPLSGLDLSKELVIVMGEMSARGIVVNNIRFTMAASDTSATRQSHRSNR